MLSNANVENPGLQEGERGRGRERCIDSVVGFTTSVFRDAFSLDLGTHPHRHEPLPRGRDTIRKAR